MAPRATTDDVTAPRRQNWDAVAAIVATLIGCLAVVVSSYTAYIQRQQVRAQVWPWLVAGNDDNAHSIDVYNKGAGPAVIRTVQVFVDGKPLASWTDVLDALGIEKPRAFEQTTINPNVLTPGEHVQIVRFPDADLWKRFRSAATAHLTMDVCFCSTLDECWMYSDRNLVGYKLSTRLVNPVDECPKVADIEMFKN